VPTVTEGRAEAAMVSGAEAIATPGATTIVIGADVAWVGLLLSLTDAVNVEAPLAVGMPDIAPVVGDRVSPEGNAPDVTAH